MSIGFTWKKAQSLAFAMLLGLLVSACGSGGWQVDHEENIRRAEAPPELAESGMVVTPPAGLSADSQVPIVAQASRDDALQRADYGSLEDSLSSHSDNECIDAECKKRDVSGFGLSSEGSGQALAYGFGGESTVEEVLEHGLMLAGASPAHISFRGSGAENSIQCQWRGIARTAGQREDAIRFWLALDGGDSIPNRLQLEALFSVALGSGLSSLTTVGCTNT